MVERQLLMWMIVVWAEFSARWVALDGNYATLEEAQAALQPIYEEGGQSLDDYRIIEDYCGVK
jgi:hypothetical protein